MIKYPNLAMILGLGTDLAYIPRFVDLLKSKSDRRILRMAERILHPRHERPKFDTFISLLKDNNSSTQHDLEKEQALQRAAKYLATTWACKEALYKSLDFKDQKSCRFNKWHKTYQYSPSEQQKHIETPETLIESRFKKPTLYNEQYFKNHANEAFLLSISHDGDYVTATVLRQLLHG